ncbi:MAG: hypothetical protein LBS29_04670 [Endomicrobium sp.]|jgi:hypothetical protein|nr:hypothetical protein [Endomicrobium sp.]
MGIIDYYRIVNNKFVQLDFDVQPYQERRDSDAILLDNTQQITLAEYSPLSKNLITAHRLKDYRRKVFTLVMLPLITLPIDYLLDKDRDVVFV